MNGAGRRGVVTVLACALCCCIASPLWAQDALSAAATTSSARAESALAGRALPDIALRLNDGRLASLSQLWRGKPLLLTLYYRRCTGTCTPFLEWVRDAVSAVGGLGRDYQVLALTFDDSETTADLAAQARALRLADAPHWHFAAASRADITRLTDTLEFSYRLDPLTQQYDHNSLLVGIEDGRIVRALLGTPEGHARLRELVWELRGRFVPMYQLPGRALLRCLAFDPASGRARLDWGLLVLVLPALVAIAAAVLLFVKPGRRTQ